MAEKNIDEILEKHNEEVKRHFDVVVEDLKDGITTNTEKIDALSKQVATNTEKITTLQEDANQIKDTLEVIKLDIEFIKNELKQKVSRDEFAALERRVSMLEAKQK